MTEQQIWFLILCYFLGAVPFGYLIVLMTGKKDIREHGSGNIGATNVLRTQGKAAGIITLLFDVFKAAIPVIYARHHFSSPLLMVAGGAIVILGHCFPVFLKFKGGKGAASFGGLLLAFDWRLLLCFLLVIIAIAAATRFVSLAVMCGTTAVFFAALFLHPAEVAALFLLLTILIIIRHQGNIKRLIAGTENKLGGAKNG